MIVDFKYILTVNFQIFLDRYFQIYFDCYSAITFMTDFLKLEQVFEQDRLIEGVLFLNSHYHSHKQFILLSIVHKILNGQTSLHDLCEKGTS